MDNVLHREKVLRAKGSNIFQIVGANDEGELAITENSLIFSKDQKQDEITFSNIKKIILVGMGGGYSFPKLF